MRAILKTDGAALRGRWQQLATGDIVCGSDAVECLKEFPGDFERIGEKDISRQIDRQMHPELYEAKATRTTCR